MTDSGDETKTNVVEYQLDHINNNVCLHNKILKLLTVVDRPEHKRCIGANFNLFEHCVVNSCIGDVQTGDQWCSTHNNIPIKIPFEHFETHYQNNSDVTKEDQPYDTFDAKKKDIKTNIEQFSYLYNMWINDLTRKAKTIMEIPLQQRTETQDQELLKLFQIILSSNQFAT